MKNLDTPMEFAMESLGKALDNAMALMEIAGDLTAQTDLVGAIMPAARSIPLRKGRYTRTQIRDKMAALVGAGYALRDIGMDGRGIVEIMFPALFDEADFYTAEEMHAMILQKLGMRA